jgi:hypothetical protein
VAVEEEQERGHALREGEDPGVVGFVESKTARVEGLREARPSPVMASTEPEASPMRATLLRVTRRRRRVRVRQPRSVEVVGAAASLSRRVGRELRSSVRRTWE